jgi:hypothetical protein
MWLGGRIWRRGSTASQRRPGDWKIAERWKAAVPRLRKFGAELRDWLRQLVVGKSSKVAARVS